MSAMGIDSMSALVAFVRAAEKRSYVAAGRTLGVSSSAVGKSVARLEEKLGVLLFNRTTRTINLTPEGALFFERCQRILADLGDAEAELVHTRGLPRGRVRLSVPAACHRILSPLLPAFASQYPEVELDVDYNDRMVDVVEEGFDLVMRSGDLADSRLTSRRVASFRFLIVAAPAYLRRFRAPPTSPRDLSHHACLVYRLPSTGRIQSWRLGEEEPSLRPVLTCNSVEALIGAARRGMGLAYLPDFAVREELANGTLVNAFPSADRPVEGVFRLVWPANRLLSPKVRALIDFLSEQLQGSEKRATRSPGKRSSQPKSFSGRVR